MPDSASVVIGPKLDEVVYADIGANFPNSLRAFLRAFDALVQASVLSLTIATPPGSPANGDAYVVAASPTGAWAGQAGNIAVWSTQIATVDTNTKVPAWEFHAPKAGWRVFNVADGNFYFYNGTAWLELAASIGRLNEASAGISIAAGGTINDLAIPASGVILLTGSPVGAVTITGMKAGAAGDIVTLVNANGPGFVVTLAQENAGSLAGNRFRQNTDHNTVLLLNGNSGAATFYYDGIRWNLLSMSPTTGQTGHFTVANLPAGPPDGALAYATDGRKVGEGAGSGTGVPVYFSNAAWRTYSGDAAVTA